MTDVQITVTVRVPDYASRPAREYFADMAKFYLDLLIQGRNRFDARMGIVEVEVHRTDVLGHAE